MTPASIAEAARYSERDLAPVGPDPEADPGAARARVRCRPRLKAGSVAARADLHPHDAGHFPDPPAVRAELTVLRRGHVKHLTDALALAAPEEQVLAFSLARWTEHFLSAHLLSFSNLNRRTDRYDVHPSLLWVLCCDRNARY